MNAAFEQMSYAAALRATNVAFTPPALSSRHQAAVEQIARAAVAAGDVPGVLAQVWRRGELICDVVAGLRDVEHDIPMDRSAIFPLASMTKPVTVALALVALDEGKLRLDDPISHWAPEFSQMRVLRRPDGPLDDTVPAIQAITVEDLMTHRAGLGYGFMTPPPLGTEMIRRLGMGMDSELTPDAWLKSLAELPLLYQPGERFNYGHSIDVLGFIAARALGLDLRTAMREKLFAPLDMVDTDLWISPDRRSQVAQPYYSSQPAHFSPSRVSAVTTDAPPAYVSGGQGLLSSAGDYLRFARMLMHDGRLDRVRVLKVATARLLRSNRFSDSQRRYPFVMGQPFTQGFGLGVFVITDATQPTASGSAGSFGWPGAFGGWWQADPQEDMVLLWLQACAPAPPQPGAPMPRMPGMGALQQFHKCVYEQNKGESHANSAG